MTISSTRKLMHPMTPPTVLHREKLVAELLQAVAAQADQTLCIHEGYKVVLLCAPAGYGKTTVLAEFAEQSSLPCCWYFLDATDENPLAFLRLLIASMRQRFPDFGFALDALLTNVAHVESAQRYQCLETVIETLMKTIVLEIPEPFALLLCDYHEIDPYQTTNALINRFIQHLPPQCSLFLESRATPNLDFSFLLAHQLVLVIGSSQLRFSAQEIRELAHLQQSDLTEQEAIHLEQEFEGWIAGILLGTRLSNTRIPFSLEASANSAVTQSGRKHLFAYLSKYVFAHQPESAHFLKETAIFRHLTPALCNAFLHITDAASRLAYLEKQGLFVIQYQSDTEDIFVCHPILRELFYEELQNTAPHHLRTLHLRAVELFRGQQDIDAIGHALAAQDFDTAAQLIEIVAAQQFAQGELKTLAQWIDTLPEATIRKYLRLLLIRATIFLEESALSNVQELLAQALLALPAGPDTWSLQAEIFLAQAKVCMQQGDYTQAQDLSSQALQRLASDEIELRASAHQIRGSCAAYLNNFNMSITELQQALQLYEPTTKTRQVGKVHTMLANFYGMTGHNALSEHHRMRAIQCWEKLNDDWGRIDDLLGLGAIKDRQGYSEAAAQLFTQALTLSRGTLQYECGEAYALANFGDLYQNQNRVPQALVSYEDSLSLARKLNEVYLVHYTLCQLARTYLLIGDPHGAQSILAQIGQTVPAVDAIRSYEQALHAFTFGLFLLQTERADTAYLYLTAAATAFVETKYEYIQALIYRAASLLACDNMQTALQLKQEVCRLAKEYNYEDMVQRELLRCPPLFHCTQNSTLAFTQQPKSRDTATENEDRIIGKPAAYVVLVPQPLPLLRIQALGMPAVYKHDVLLTNWRMARSMELFFLLLNTAHSLHKGRIISDLWQEGEEPTDQTWRSTLHYLRKTLDRTSVHSHNGIYTLQLKKMYTVEYDVEQFQNLFAQAQAAQRTENDEGAERAFERMLDLYKGDFVTTFYSDWCIPRRNELRQSCLDAHYQLALIAYKNLDFEKSIFYWKKIISMNAMLEYAHEGLIRCYIQQGHRNLALYHYHYYATTLQNELDILPGESLQILYQNLMKSS